MNGFKTFRMLVVIMASGMTFFACCPCDYVTKDGMEGEYKKEGEGGEQRPIRLNELTLITGTRFTDSRYDFDGNKQDLSGGFGEQSRRLTYVGASYTRHLLGGLDLFESKFSLKGRTWLDYASLSEEFSYNGMTMEECGSGLRSTGLEAMFGTRRLMGSQVGGKLVTGYQFNLEREPDAADPKKQQFSSRQNAFYLGTEWDYWCKGMKLNLDAYYHLTSARDDYDVGDFFSVAGGGGYGFRVGEKATIVPGLQLSYTSRSKIEINGNEIADSEGYLLSLTPEVGVRLRGTGLNFKVAYGYHEEFQGIRTGGIPLAGKNSFVPGGFTGSLTADYRF